MHLLLFAKIMSSFLSALGIYGFALELALPELLPSTLSECDALFWLVGQLTEEPAELDGFWIANAIDAAALPFFVRCALT